MRAGVAARQNGSSMLARGMDDDCVWVVKSLYGYYLSEYEYNTESGMFEVGWHFGLDSAMKLKSEVQAVGLAASVGCVVRILSDEE